VEEKAHHFHLKFYEVLPPKKKMQRFAEFKQQTIRGRCVDIAD